MADEFLDGNWAGESQRADGTKTIWMCSLQFNHETGQIHGDGNSFFEGKDFPFHIVGAFNRSLSECYLLKQHPHSETLFHFRIDLDTLTLRGRYSHGTAYLEKFAESSGLFGSHFPAFSDSGSYSSSFPLAPINPMYPFSTRAPEPIPSHLSYPVISHEKVDDKLYSFLLHAFGHSASQAQKYIELFEKNEVDFIALTLSLDSSCDSYLKEMGIPLGPRMRIVHFLQEFIEGRLIV